MLYRADTFPDHAARQASSDPELRSAVTGSWQSVISVLSYLILFMRLEEMSDVSFSETISVAPIRSVPVISGSLMFPSGTTTALGASLFGTLGYNDLLS